MEEWILLLDEDTRIGVWEIIHEFLEGGIGGVGLGCNAEVDGQFVRRVILAEGRGQTVVEMRFKTFDRTNEGDVCRVQGGRGRGFCGFAEEVLPSEIAKSVIQDSRSEESGIHFKIPQSTNKQYSGIPNQANPSSSNRPVEEARGSKKRRRSRRYHGRAAVAGSNPVTQQHPSTGSRKFLDGVLYGIN